MKKYFNFTLLTLAALLFTGCSSEEEIAGNGGTTDAKGTLTFVLPMTKGATTYAIVNNDENKLDIPGMKIYMFSDDADPVLEKIYSGADIVKGDNGTNATASIIVPDGISGNKTFYFVGNTETVQGAAANQLGTAVEGTTPLSVFSKLVTDNQDALTYLSPANGLLLTGKSATINVASTASANVSLKRRVARFDVDNIATTSNVTIKEILIYKANLAGYIFDNNDPARAAGLTTGDLTKITYTGKPNANTGITESLFYLYPTAVGSTTTTIQLVTTVKDGTEKIFTVKAASILPNKRYFIKAKDNNGIEFVLEVADWDDAGDLETEVQGAVGFSNATSTEVVGWNGASYTFDATNNGTTITLDVAAQSAKGVEYEIVNTLGNLPGITTVVDPTATLTYAASYKQAVTVTIPKYEGVDDMAVEIRFKDKANSKSYTAITVFSDKTGTYYPGTKLKTVKFAGVNWAPVNVGATTDDATVLSTSSCGIYFQWGRNTGFAYENKEIVQGPVSSGDAIGQYANKFIKAVSPGDWLDQPNASLWGSTSQGACPNGWRIPSYTELKALKDKLGSNIELYLNPTKNRIEIPAEDGKYLYLPLAGLIRNVTGIADSRGSNGRYWGGNPSGNGAQMFIFGGTKSEIEVHPRASGFSVRCIKVKQ